MNLEDEELEEQQNEDEEDEYYVFPEHPVIMEDDLIHDGVHLCGDPACPCATYGYLV